MGLRTELHTILCDLLGASNVYFQSPGAQQMSYPCIVYERYSGRTMYANDKPYSHLKRYSVTVIDRNPDSLIPDKVAMLPTSIFDRHFVANNLNHYVFNLYY